MAIYTQYQNTSLINPSRSLPRNRAGRLLRGLPRRETFPRICATAQQPPGTRKSPGKPPYASGNPLRLAWSSLLYDIRMTSRLPRRAGIPDAFIRQFDARPDSSDLGNSSPGDSTSWLGGRSDRPVILQTIH